MTDDLLWMGNHFASDGQLCGAVGTWADLRVYADALTLERFFVKAGGSRPLIIFSHGLRLEL